MNIVRNLDLKPFRQIPKTTLIGGISLLLISSILLYMWQTYHPSASAIPNAKVELGDLVTSVTATGTIDVDNTLNIRTTSEGQILNVMIEPGSHVKAGDLLVKMDGYDIAKHEYDAMNEKVNHLKQFTNLAQQKIAVDQKQSPAIAAQLLVDQAAITTAMKQLDTAQKGAQDGEQIYKAATGVNEAQKQTAKMDLDKALSAASIQQKIVIQAQKKLQNDQTALTANAEAQRTLDEQAVNIANKQLTVAQNTVASIQNQLNQTVASDSAASKVTVQSAKQALDQANGNVALLQLQVNQAQTKLSNDTSNVESSDVLDADQSSLAYLQQQLSTAQILATDAANQYQAEQSQGSAGQATLQTTLDQAKGAVEIAQAELDQANAKLQTDQDLANSNTSLSEDNDQIENAAEQLKAAQYVLADAQAAFKSAGVADPSTIANAKANLDQIKGNVSVNEALLAQAQAKLTADHLPPDEKAILEDQESALQAQLQEEEAEVELSKSKKTLDQVQIVAPVDGLVVSVPKKLGDTLAAGEGVCVLMPTEPKHQVVGLVPASDVSKVNAGEHVQIESAQFSEPVTGIVKFISPISEVSSTGTQTNQYKVYVDVDHLPKQVRSGMTVRIKIETATKHQVKRVPIEAVMDDNGKEGVYVQDPSKKTDFTFKEITIGATNDKYVEAVNLSVGTVVALKKP